MSFKRTLIDTFFKTRFEPAPSLPEPVIIEETKPEQVYFRSQSSQSQFKGVQSRPSSVCSNRSSNIERTSSFDPNLPPDLTASIKKLSLRTFLNFARQPVDENSLCLVFAFMLLVGLVDPQGPAGMIKNSKNKVVPAFQFYLKNTGKIVQIVRKIPKTLKKQENSNVLKKVQGLMKIVELKKILPFAEIHDFISETVNFAVLCLDNNDDKKLIIRGPETSNLSTGSRNLKEFIATISAGSNNFNKKERNTSSFDLSSKNLQRPSKARHEKSGSFSGAIKTTKNSSFQPPLKENFEKRQMSKKKVSSGDPLDHPKSHTRTERFLLDSRINKRIQEKLEKYMKDNPVEDFSKVIQDFVSTLPCSEVNSNTYKLAELYLNKHCK